MYIIFDLFDQIQATTFILKKKIFKLKNVLIMLVFFVLKRFLFNLKLNTNKIM
jgi:hypothetical protein